MLPTIVLAAVIAAVWRFGVWPFSRSYKYLPSYGQVCRNRTAAATQPPVVAPPPRPTV
jgi:hypothetical protein